MCDSFACINLQRQSPWRDSAPFPVTDYVTGVMKGHDCVILVTKKNSIVEVVNKKVVKSVEFPWTVGDVRAVLWISSYNPNTQFYVLHGHNGSVHFINRQTEKICRSLKDAVSVQVGDFLDLGFPQVMVDSFGDLRYTDGLRDFSNVRNTDPTAHKQVAALTKRLQKSMEVVEKAELESFQQKQLVRETLSSLVYKNQEDSSGRQPLKMVDHWKRYIRDQLIIGFKVKNMGSVDVDNVVLSLTCNHHSVRYRSCIITDGITEHIPAHCAAHIIGCCDAPVFTQDKLIYSCLLSYRNSEKKEGDMLLPCGNLTVDASELLSNKYALVSLHNNEDVSEEDIVSLLGSAVVVKLSVQNHDVEAVLLDLGYRLVRSIFYNADDTQSALYLSCIAVTSPTVVVYARDNAQALLVVHALYQHLPQDAVIVPCTQHVASTSSPLLEEVRMLQGLVDPVSLQTYKEVRENLLQLELKTDSALS